MSLDWRKPWLWSRRYQQGVRCLGVIVGLGLGIPHGWRSWQAWSDAQDLQAMVREQHRSTQALQLATAEIARMQNTSALHWRDVSELTDRTISAGLEWRQQSIGLTKSTAALAAMQLQETPVQLQAQGAWHAWLDWLKGLPQTQPGAVVQSLALEMDPQEGIRADMTLVTTQPAKREMDSAAAMPGDPFDAARWAKALQQRAQQHASYNTRVLPEQQRPRQALELVSIESLRYVGQISQGTDVQALVRLDLVDAGAARTSSSFAPIHRVRLGAYLGQHYGRVIAISANELQLRELVLAPSGEWQHRDMRLVLQVQGP